VLEDCEITRIGAETAIPINTRIISATNQDLEKMIKEGTFREDLYFRLNVIALHIPPLRERLEDIAVLSHYFMEALNEEQGTSEVTISDKAINSLMKMPLHGNIRELRNIIQRLYYLRDGNEVTVEDINKVVSLDKNEVDHYAFNELLDKSLPLVEARRLFERIYLNLHLQKNGYNVSQTAHILKMIPNNLFRRIKELGLSLPKKYRDR
jgi:Nif-specific regulatory protein